MSPGFSTGGLDMALKIPAAPYRNTVADLAAHSADHHPSNAWTPISRMGHGYGIQVAPLNLSYPCGAHHSLPGSYRCHKAVGMHSVHGPWSSEIPCPEWITKTNQWWVCKRKKKDSLSPTQVVIHGFHMPDPFLPQKLLAGILSC